MLPSRLTSLILSLLVVFLIYHATSLRDTYPYFQRAKGPSGNRTDLALRVQSYIDQVAAVKGLTEHVDWMSWHIKPVISLAESTSITKIPIKFQHRGGFRRVGIYDESRAIFEADPVMRLPISTNIDLPTDADASPYLFALSTTYERMLKDDMAMIRSWRRWMTKISTTKSNGANLLILLDRATNDQVGELEVLLKSAGIEALLYTTDDRISTATRYLALVEELRTFGGVLSATHQHKQWFALVEDTIFLPSITSLSERLQQFDTDGEVYVGLPSDKADWVESTEGITTYGGGAVFLTRGAVNRILTAPCADLEISSEPPFQAKKWDALIQQCLTQYADLRMNVLPALYVPPSPSSSSTPGEKVEAPPLAAHINAHKEDLVRAHLVTDACGERCFLQTFAFADNWVLTNGREISRYDKKLRIGGGVQAIAPDHLASQIVLDDVDLQRRNGQLDGNREVWHLIDAMQDEDGSVWQAYLKQAGQHRSAEAVDSLIVLRWETP